MDKYKYNMLQTERLEKCLDYKALSQVSKALRSTKTTVRRDGRNYVLETVYGTMTVMPTKLNTMIRFENGKLRVVNTDVEEGDNKLVAKRTYALQDKLRKKATERCM